MSWIDHVLSGLVTSAMTAAMAGLWALARAYARRHPAVRKLESVATKLMPRVEEFEEKP